MKKKIALIIVTSLAMATNSIAQNTDVQTATLQHEGKTTVFYGINALAVAYSHASDTLDIITLSPGTFYPVRDIGKSIKIVGAGCDAFPNSTVGTTRITDRVHVTDEAGHIGRNVHIEGIDFGENDVLLRYGSERVTITRCKMKYIYVDSRAELPITNMNVRQCVITEGIQGWGNNKLLINAYISNCWIGAGVRGFSTESTIFIDHCILRNEVQEWSYQPFYYQNNIIFTPLDNSAKSFNNVFVDCEYVAEDGENNWNGVSASSVFMDGNEDGSYDVSKTYSVNSAFQGTDGTPVGVQGGEYGWTLIPNIPRITYSQLDTSNIGNGTIKVSIRAEAPTK